MLARRFLGCLFVLILLAVAGAFLFFEFGSQALIATATPAGHYRPPPPSDAGPDYSKAENWLSRPGLADDPARWLPDGFEDEGGVAGAATFYIHPTTYLERDRWNAPLRPDSSTEARTRLVLETQANAFNGVSDIWAPRYRQAAFGAFLLKSADATAALDLAYRDVLRAFDAFLASQPPGKPIILAGHSQGSLHLARLLVDRKQALKGRLVAAYVVGWPLSVTADLPAMGLLPCTQRGQSGCVLSWQSFGDPANPSLVLHDWDGSKGFTGAKRGRGDLLCVNPLSPEPGAQAGPGANAGTLVPNATLTGATIRPGLVGAECEQGLLIVHGQIPPLGPYVLPGNNYHVFDYALFWANIRQDAARRLAQFEANR